MAGTLSALSAEQAWRLARDRLASGQVAAAEDLCRKLVSAAPRYYPAVELLATLLEATGRTGEALDLYERAIGLMPGEGHAYSRAAILRLRGVLGPPPPARPGTAGRDRISMVTLGTNGRLGNQILQYAFLRLYSAEHELIAEAPDWLGRDLFDLDDPLPSGPLPRLREDKADWFGSLNRKTSSRYANVDLGGYFCGETSAWGNRQSQFRQLFQPGHKIAGLLQNALAKVRARGQTLVAIHLRRGDFGYGQFWVAPIQWYSRWLHELWPRLDSPALYVASDDPNSAAKLAEFAPLTCRDIGVTLPGAEFMIDHYLMSQADALATSNSTFSFTAAMLNERAHTFVRPDPDSRLLTPFDPWNARMILLPTEDSTAVSAGERLVISRLKKNDTILHIGEFCTQWTTCVRAMHPLFLVREIDPEQMLDRYRAENRLARLNFVRIDDGVSIGGTIEGARQSLNERLIDVLQFKISDRESQESAAMLLAAGYAIHPLGTLGLKPPIGLSVAGQEILLAVAPEVDVNTIRWPGVA